MLAVPVFTNQSRTRSQKQAQNLIVLFGENNHLFKQKHVDLSQRNILCWLNTPSFKTYHQDHVCNLKHQSLLFSTNLISIRYRIVYLILCSIAVELMHLSFCFCKTKAKGWTVICSCKALSEFKEKILHHYDFKLYDMDLHFTLVG